MSAEDRGRTTARTGVVALAATALTTLAVLLLAVAPFSPAVEPARGAAPAGGDPFAVTGAQLRWGLSNEANNRAFAPQSHNFLSAGLVPDPGRGGTTLPQSAWKAADGNVRIEKQQADGSYAAATWAGLTTTPQGTAIPSPTSGRFSNHQVVLDAGVGTVDPAAGSATISWTGSFSVIFYSGLSYFTVTDPTLDVTPERAQLTATLGGHASDMDDQSQWTPLPPTRVVLADLPRAEVDLAASDGFASTPAYLGVAWQAPADQATQVGGPWKGAFPSSFLDFLARAGTAGYWYSTGGATDAFKQALPLTVSWAGAPVATPTPSPTAAPTKGSDTSPTTGPTKGPTKGPSQGASQGPTKTPTATPTTSPTTPPVATPTARPGDMTAPVPDGLAGSDAGAADPDAPGAAAAGVRGTPLAVQPLLVSATTSAPPMPAAAAAGETESHTLWLLGCVLLLGALATTLISTTLVSNPVEGKK